MDWIHILYIAYTPLVLHGQWQQAISHLRLFSWLDSARLKSFMDSSHAFYKVKHRYWPELLFVLHFVFVSVQCLASISLNCGYVTFVIFCIKLFSLYIVEYTYIPPLHSICNVDWNSCFSACKYDCMASVNTLKESTHL